MPSKLPSYLACGRPILASADGEVADIVREAGAGMAAPAENAPSLAEAAVRLAAASREERASMGERGREYNAAHFDRERLLSRLETHCRELVKRR
jgi:glycosyltransferase involved in cell wall biosynthesis